MTDSDTARARYRKKPVVIEAVQVTDATFDNPHPNPEHIAGLVYDPVKRCVLIKTLEGEMRADLGDWIIRGVKGELYPCKPDIFAATYEPARALQASLEERAREVVDISLAKLRKIDPATVAKCESDVVAFATSIQAEALERAAKIIKSLNIAWGQPFTRSEAIDEAIRAAKGAKEGA